MLRSGDRPGAGQELWALLTLYQLLRMAMVTAVETRPGANPDRASFTTALETAREELTAARGICPAGPADLPGAIGRAVLSTLLAARRPRYSARKVKCATSRYLARHDGRPRTVTAITAISVTLTTPPLDPPGGRPRPRTHRKNPARTGPQPPTRRQRVTALMTTEPHRDWSGRNSPNASRSPPATCTPSSANGPRPASSPAPASLPTPSARRQPAHPRQARQTLNYAALRR